jgi:hypothetical protein
MRGSISRSGQKGNDAENEPIHKNIACSDYKYMLLLMFHRQNHINTLKSEYKQLSEWERRTVLYGNKNRQTPSQSKPS